MNGSGQDGGGRAGPHDQSVLSYDDGALFANWGLDYVGAKHLPERHRGAGPHAAKRHGGLPPKQLGPEGKRPLQLNVSNR